MEHIPGWPKLPEKLPNVIAVGIDDTYRKRLQSVCHGQVRLITRSPTNLEDLNRLLDHISPAVVLQTNFFNANPGSIIRQLKAPPHRSFLPFIAIVDNDIQRREIESMGIDAAFTRPYKSEDIEAVLLGRLAYHEQIEQQLGIDPATGLLGPQVFMERVEDAVSLSRRYRMNGCMGTINLVSSGDKDNENLDEGAGAASLALRWAATVTRAAVRDVDLLGLLSNMSLGLLFHSTPIGGGIVAMRRVLDHLQETTTDTLDGTRLTIETTGTIASFGENGIEYLLARIHRAIQHRPDRTPGTLIIL